MDENAVCLRAQGITGDAVFIGIQWFRVLVSIAACFCSVASAVFVLKLKLYHLNLRILIVNLSFPCFGYCALTAYRSARYIHVFFTASGPCDFRTMFYPCAMQMAAASALYQACISAILVSAVERTLATLSCRDYEHKRHYVRTALMVIASWWQPIFTVVFFYLTPATEDNYQAYCTSQTIGNYPSQVFNYMFIPSLCLSILTCGVLYCYNRKMNKVYHESPRALSHGYQLYENIHTTRSVLLSACILLVLTLINFALAMIAGRLFISIFPYVKECTNMSIAFFAILNLVALVLNRTLRIVKNRNLRSHRLPDNVHNYGTSAEYFSKLQEYWMSRAKTRK